MLHGIIITRFDLKIGPLAEYVYPKDFMGEGELFDLSFRIWTGAGFLNLSEAKGFTYQTYNPHKKFGITIFDTTDTLGTYAITCLFSEDDSALIVPNIRKFQDVISKANEKIKDGKMPESVLEELYTQLVELYNEIKERSLAPREVKMLPQEKRQKLVNGLSVVFSNIRKLKELAANLNDEALKKELLASIEVISSALMTIASSVLESDEISQLLSKLL